MLEIILIYFLVSIALGLAVAFAHRFLKNKFARANLWLFAWVAIAAFLLSLGWGICMCGYPLGFHHHFHSDFWFPIVYLILAFAYPAVFFNEFFVFWLVAIVFSRARRGGESLKSLWGCRIFRFAKIYALAALTAAAVSYFHKDFDPYWGCPKILGALIAAAFFAVIFAGYKSPKRYWALALVLFLPAFYYSKTIPEMADRGANIAGTFSAPKIKFQYSPETDKRDYASRKIASEPSLQYTFHEYAGGWNLRALKSNPPKRYYFYSAAENPEIFELVYADLTKCLPLIDDSEKTKELLDFLSDKPKITFLKTQIKLGKCDPTRIVYDIYIFNDSRGGFYKLHMYLCLEGEK